MPFERIMKYPTLGAFLLLVVGAAYAQDAAQHVGSSAPPLLNSTVVAQAATAQSQPAPATPSAPALTMDQMRTQATAILEEIDSTTDLIRKMLRKAREERDAIKTLCLDDKLTQTEVARSSANERSEALDQAIRQRDQEMANHNFTIMSVLKERVMALGAEANQCIGVVEGFVGDSNVTVDVDPEIPSTDPSEFPDLPNIIIPPPCVSCAQ